MKKLINILLGALLVTFIGCAKVLDVEPYSAVPFATAFDTPDHCLLSLNGVYDAAQSGAYPGGTERRGYPFGAASIEQSDTRGEDLINLQSFFQITYQATYNPTSANNVAMWDNLYALINKANVCIDGFQEAGKSGVLTPAIALEYEAECKFLRAMAHHEAVIHFSRPYLDGNGDSLGIPYRDFAISNVEASNKIRETPRPKVAEVYTKILSDLDFAETNLPATRSTAILKTTRATKAAAIALKMRAKLHMGDWSGVITDGAKVVPAAVTPTSWTSVVSPIGGWVMSANVDGPFVNNANNESIFSIKNDAQDAPSTNGGLAAMFGAASLGGRGLVSVSPILYNNTGWLCGNEDKRRTTLYVQGTNALATQSVFTNKFRDYTTRGDYAPMIRYPEVLLTLAEAEARQGAGVTQRALDLLNTVRNRALADLGNAYTLSSFADKVALVKAILLERRIEFLAEGKRWGDISRNAKDPNYTTSGIPAKAINGAAGLTMYNCGTAYAPGQAAIPYSDYKFIWPIPNDEVINNPIIKQNPGY